MPSGTERGSASQAFDHTSNADADVSSQSLADLILLVYACHFPLTARTQDSSCTVPVLLALIKAQY